MTAVPVTKGFQERLFTSKCAALEALLVRNRGNKACVSVNTEHIPSRPGPFVPFDLKCVT